MDILHQVIESVINGFDINLCISINIATYITIKIVDDLNGKAKVNTWTKRLILLAVILIASAIWYKTGSDVKLIVNSAILSPVFWSWVMKPVCNKLNIDYKKDVGNII